MKNRPLKNLLGILLCGISLSTNAVQTCRTEAEIPSTTPATRYTDHGNGIVTDAQTNLMWAKCALGQDALDCSGTATTHTWQGALTAAAVSTLAGHSDWRLPDVNELRSIAEQRCYGPAINLAVFPNTPFSSAFWSASPYADYSDRAWYVGFYFGFSYGYYRDRGLGVRLVRGGQ